MGGQRHAIATTLAAMALGELRAFLAVASHGSFLAAAEELGVSRTTLRREVDALDWRRL